jgi:hypothetical protein
MPKFLIQTRRDNGPAGVSNHTLLTVNAADEAQALSVARQTLPADVGAGVFAVPFELAAADTPAAAAIDGATVNVLDETSMNAIGGARDMLEDVVTCGGPDVVAGRCWRAANHMTTVFGLPPGPATERAAARMAEIQTKPAGSPALPPASAAAAESVAERGPEAGIQSDEMGARPAGVYVGVHAAGSPAHPAQVRDAQRAADAAAADAAAAAEVAAVEYAELADTAADTAAAAAALASSLPDAGAGLELDPVAAAAAQTVEQMTTRKAA